jgi:transcriptional regulator with XRE-family HTH domain
MTIGQRLKEARLSRKMTQPDLAKAVGVSKGAIGNYETDVSSPKETILVRLMEVLQIDANFLYQDYISISAQISTDEKHLIDLYRNANDQAREDAVRVLESHQKKDMSSKAE